jgi:predicted transcriptional regulator
MPSKFFDEKETMVLKLDRRRKIYEIVRAFAGCHFREIQRRSELPTGSVRYHLDYLVRSGLIKSQKEGNNLRYYPREFKSQNVQLLGLLRQERVRQIILFILLNKNCNQEDITKHVGLSPSTVSWHLKKLEESNVVGFVKEGREKKYSLLVKDDEIMKLLISYRETFYDALVDRAIEMWDID